MNPTSPVNRVDAWLPARRLLLLGLQHVLVMYAGAVAVPLIVGRALHLSSADLALLINADLFACGVATLIQTLGPFGIGIRLPIMMGTSFASVSPMLALIGTSSLAPGETLQVLYGAVIAAGVAALLLAPLMGSLQRWFPPVVTGSVILVIGLSLMRIGIEWVGGGLPSAADYGSALHWVLALVVLAAILLLVRFGRGLLRAAAVLIGIAVGAVLAAAFKLMSFADVGSAAWVAWVAPLRFGMPHFVLSSCISMTVVMIVIMVESFGMFLAVGALVGVRPDARALTRGLLADGVGTILGGVFNAFPYTSYSQNIGLIGLTGVASRYVCAAGGVIMALLGLSPKLGALMAALPASVVGGAGLVMFGMIAATGVRTLAEVDFRLNRYHALIVAITISVGLMPTLSSKLFQFLPPALAPLLNSGIALATAAAIVLNLFFNAGESNSEKPVQPVASAVPSGSD